jgi:hypothetical protein
VTDAAWEVLKKWYFQVHGEALSDDCRGIDAKLASMLEPYREPHETLSDVIITLFPAIGPTTIERRNH